MLATKTPAFTRRSAVETIRKETLSAALEWENGELIGEATDVRANRPVDLNGYSKRPPQGTFAEEQLATSKTRNCAPVTAILRRHWERKSSLEEVILELYHGTISVAKADEVARLLWGDGASAALIGDCARKVSERIQPWLLREIPEPQIYVFLHSLSVKQKINGETRDTTIFAAIGVGRSGNREILSVASAAGSAGTGWNQQIANLKKRGLHGPQLFVGENDPAVSVAVARHFPAAHYQGDLVQLESDVLRKVAVTDVHFVTNAFEEIRASATHKLAATKLATLVDRLKRGEKLEAAALLESGGVFQFSYYRFPKSHWKRLRDSRPLRQVLREFREWIRLCGPVSDDHALVLMVATRLRYAARRSWALRCFISFKS